MNTIKVAGVDPSLTATGVAILRFDNGSNTELATHVVKSWPVGMDLLGRSDRIAYLVHRVNELIAADNDVVVIEGPAFSSKTGSVWDRAGYWWTLVESLINNGQLVVEIPPTRLKKWATGKGTASKTAVAVSMSKRFPTVDTLDHRLDDNEWDALALASMGTQATGLLSFETEYQREIVLDSFGSTDLLDVWDDTRGDDDK